jgi:hypothetical protein
MQALRRDPEAEKQRAAIREAIAFKKYEFDAHGVEMNQRYKSDAVVTDGQMEPAFELDAELHYQPTTWPGARMPHVWVFDRNTAKGTPRSIFRSRAVHDADRHRRRGLGSGCRGGWQRRFGIESASTSSGRAAHIVDHTGDWARAREIGERLRAGAAGPACLPGAPKNWPRPRSRTAPGAFHDPASCGTPKSARRRSERNGHGSARTGLLHRRKLSASVVIGRNAKAQNERAAEVMEVITGTFMPPSRRSNRPRRNGSRRSCS